MDGLVFIFATTHCVLQRRTAIAILLAELVPERDGERAACPLRMIYWEITLRDHLLLPITPDSSSDTTYARLERDNIRTRSGLSLLLVRDTRKGRCSLLATAMR
ncbi:hypothetical protein QE152_g26658 [Popillia japonica]|uniref:Secreted protein n=1 Tax=Popillia japonica TaxID=7064 RepID=A0AAW1JYL7_POPJA